MNYTAIFTKRKASFFVLGFFALITAGAEILHTTAPQSAEKTNSGTRSDSSKVKPPTNPSVSTSAGEKLKTQNAEGVGDKDSPTLISNTEKLIPGEKDKNGFEIVDASYSDFSDLQKHVVALEAAVSKLSTSTSETGGNQQLIDLRDSLENLYKIVSGMPSSDTLQTKIAAVDGAIEEMNSTISKLNELAGKINGKEIEEAFSVARKIQEESQGLSKKSEALQAELNTTRIEQKTAKDRMDELDKKDSVKDAQIDEVKSEQKGARAELETLNKNFDDFRNHSEDEIVKVFKKQVELKIADRLADLEGKIRSGEEKAKKDDESKSKAYADFRAEQSKKYDELKEKIENFDKKLAEITKHQDDNRNEVLKRLDDTKAELVKKTDETLERIAKSEAVVKDASANIVTVDNNCRVLLDSYKKVVELLAADETDIKNHEISLKNASARLAELEGALGIGQNTRNSQTKP